jgi:short subunit dehydrogenase-like uncharacterized protein
MSDRDFDLVLWGATGYTGRLVGQYLATSTSAAGIRWALGGRDREKLEQVRAELPDADLPLVVADVNDDTSLDAMTRSTRVLCTTAGPYARCGSSVVSACVRNRTHYCDLTGEVRWVRQMIDAHHEAARANGTRIVHCCGFDSIPSDLGVLMLHDAMQSRGRKLGRVDAFFGESKGGASGGTVASMLDIADAIRDRDVRRLLNDPYALAPGTGTRGPDRPDRKGIHYEPRLGRWTAPFPMAAINTRVVRRSNAVAGYPYGRDFRYTEQMSLPPGFKGLVAATAVTGGLAGFLGALQVRPLRRLIERRLPKPGEGPSAELRAAGYFVLRLLAEPANDGPALRLIGRVEDRRDPGYGSTAVMLSESALCLARDELTTEGGVLTPASAMGLPLIERLRRAGMIWEVAEDAAAQSPSPDSARSEGESEHEMR